jgi:hypothetical protein
MATLVTEGYVAVDQVGGANGRTAYYRLAERPGPTLTLKWPTARVIGKLVDLSYSDLYTYITEHPLGGAFGGQIEELLTDLIHDVILEDIDTKGLDILKAKATDIIGALEMWTTIMKEALANPTWEMPVAKTALMQDPGIQELHDELIRNSESDVKEN